MLGNYLNRIKAKYYSLRSRFSLLSKTGKIKLFGLLLIVLVIPLTVVMALTVQNLQQRASAPDQRPMIGAYYFGWFSPSNFTANTDYGFTRQWANGVPPVDQTNRYGTKNLYAPNGVDPLAAERNLETDPWAGVRDLYNNKPPSNSVLLRQSEKDNGNLWWSPGEAAYRQHFKPLIGYYDSSDPQVLQKQIDQATSRGLSYFNFYWYWSLAHKETYDGALKAFMEAPNPQKMKFMISIWDGGFNLSIPEDDIEASTDKLVEYMRHENYLKIDGKPVIQIGNINGVSDKDLFVRRLREKAGTPIIVTLTISQGMVNELDSKPPPSNVDAYTCLLPITNFSSQGFENSSNALTGKLDEWGKKVGSYTGGRKTFMPCAFSGFDERPRLGIRKDPLTLYKEYLNPGIPQASLFKSQLEKLKLWMDSRSASINKHLTIYAWNEWHEGGIIEPHVAPNSFAYLAAIQSVFALPPWDGNSSTSPTPSPTASPRPNGDATITSTVLGKTLSISTKNKYAGAIGSLVWNGKEFVNTWDHGRELQTAIFMDMLGECYNPTEAGGDYDGRGNSTHSVLQSISAQGNKLTTVVSPAFYRLPGVPYVNPNTGNSWCGRADGQNGRPFVNRVVNTTRLSDYTIKKDVEIGYEGINNVIKYEVTETIPRVHKEYVTEANTAYLPTEFTSFWYFDPQTGQVSSFAGGGSPGNKPIIVSTPDRNYALGIYGTKSDPSNPTRMQGPGYSISRYNLSPAENATTKMNCIYSVNINNVGNTPIGDYKYNCFVVVGTLDDVKNGMGRLAQVLGDSPLPKGNHDSSSCSISTGWACDPNNFEAPLSVHFYADGTPTGGGRFIGSTVANILREEAVGNKCSGFRAHGYSFNTPQSLKDGTAHTINAYAINIGAPGPNPLIPGSGKQITCDPSSSPLPSVSPSPSVIPSPTQSPSPSLIPTPTPTVTPTPTPVPLPGDFNGDRLVDLADYNIWESEFLGSASTKRSDANNDGKVDLLDYAVWVEHYNP